jgi:hypothetical protein
VIHLLSNLQAANFDNKLLSNSRRHQLLQSDNLTSGDYDQSDRGNNLQMCGGLNGKVGDRVILPVPYLPQKTLFPHGALGASDRAVLPLSTLELRQQ